MQRRLAAILALDMVGYSRLMAADERSTLERQKHHRTKLIDPQIAQFGGRTVKTTGDGLLAEFPSVVDAVQCAIETQRLLSEAEKDEPEAKRICYRIGINLGDIVFDEGDIFGDGVNIAARLEGLADPGGICVSDSVHQHLYGKLDAAFEDLGKQTLKNLGRQVQVWKWSNQTGGDLRSPLPQANNRSARDRPSIAVLPFNNLSGDQEQEYFSDGITEDLITELSRFKNLFVLARNTSFVFKGQAVDVAEAAKRLGVQYMVEGSVRKTGNRVRITAQLIDALSGEHLWAERYDRDLKDVFEVQDEVVRVVAGTIPGVLARVGVEFARRKPTESATAFDCTLRGRWALNHSTEGSGTAIKFLERAVEADADFATAQAWLAYAYYYAIFTLGLDPETATERCCAHATRAVTLDSNNPEVNAVAAISYLLSGQHEKADIHSARAVGENPNDELVLYSRGLVLAYLGRPAEALPYFHQMEEVDPYAPDDTRADGYCDCLFLLGEYERMIEIYDRWPEIPIHLYLVKASALAKLGRLKEARACVEHYKSLEGAKLDAALFVKLHMRMLARLEDRENWLDAYRTAGIIV